MEHYKKSFHTDRINEELKSANAWIDAELLTSRRENYNVSQGEPTASGASSVAPSDAPAPHFARSRNRLVNTEKNVKSEEIKLLEAVQEGRKQKQIQIFQGEHAVALL